jgi:hypothetical protein
MGKLARLLSLPSQLCHAHGIHLAMVEFLYTNEVPANISKIVAATPQPVPEERADEEDWEDEESYCEGLKIEIEVQDAILPQYDANLKSIIAKVRKLMIFFRVSPTKMSYLQQKLKVSTKKVLTCFIGLMSNCFP